MRSTLRRLLRKKWVLVWWWSSDTFGCHYTSIFGRPFRFKYNPIKWFDLIYITKISRPRSRIMLYDEYKLWVMAGIIEDFGS